MSGADMCDVLHHVLEEDVLRVVSAAENPLKAMDAIRASLHSYLYESSESVTARPPATSSKTSAGAHTAARPMPTKAYIPPTSPSDDPELPFGGAIGKPLG